MSPHVPTAQVGIVATKTLTLLLGGLITYYSYKAYRRTGARELGALAVGFAIVTLGAFGGGLLDLVGSRFFQVDLALAVFFQSLLTTLGLAVILYSLHTRS